MRTELISLGLNTRRHMLASADRKFMPSVCMPKAETTYDWTPTPGDNTLMITATCLARAEAVPPSAGFES